MQNIELVKGDCSHPPLNDDVSDDYLSILAESDMEYEYYDMHAYHDSYIMPKWHDKTIQVVGDLAGDPLDTRKTRYEFHSEFSTCDSNIIEKCFMMIAYDPQSYK